MTYLAIVLALVAVFLTSIAAFCFWTREAVGMALGAVLGLFALDAWAQLYVVLSIVRFF